MTHTMILGFMLLASACASQHEQNTSDVLSIAACSGPIHSDPYVLGQMSLDVGDLLVQLQTSGGCARHGFAVCWDGLTYDTAPPSIDLAVSHDAHGDTCDALLFHDLRIPLTPVIEAEPPPLNVRITGASGQSAGTTNLVRVPG